MIRKNICYMALILIFIIAVKLNVFVGVKLKQIYTENKQLHIDIEKLNLQVKSKNLEIENIQQQHKKIISVLSEMKQYNEISEQKNSQLKRSIKDAQKNTPCAFMPVPDDVSKWLREKSITTNTNP